LASSAALVNVILLSRFISRQLVLPHGAAPYRPAAVRCVVQKK